MADSVSPGAEGATGGRADNAVCRLAAATAALAGWRRTVLAAALGAAAVLAMPPWHVVPLLFGSFVALVWLLDGAAATARPVRSAAATGFWFGFGYFAVGIHWLAEAFLVDPARHGWMIPFALGGLSALLALFPAAACTVAVVARRRLAITGPGRVLLFAASWVFFEWLRGWILSGFPWNLVGYAWSFSTVMVQPAALAGVHGLSLATIVAAAMPALLGDRRLDRRSLVAVALALLMLAAMLGFGWLRLQSAPAIDPAAPGAEFVDGVRLRVVQAGIPQRLKWRADLRMAHLMRHIALSRADGGSPPTVVIWPETAVPFYLENDARAREIAATAAPPGGLLLTGTVRTETIAGRRLYRNSAIALSPTGEIVAVYDKTHLVPFGEFVPFASVLPFDKIVAGAGDFAAGPGLRTLELPGLPPVGPLICYEAIFPGAVAAPRQRPHWLLNLTNDGWFGANAGPRQHLAIATMRAVEEGLPLVRAAGTGISAIVDPYGRSLGSLEIGEIGVLDRPLPRPLPATPYARFGDAVPATFLFLCVVLSYFCRRS